MRRTALWMDKPAKSQRRDWRSWFGRCSRPVRAASSCCWQVPAAHTALVAELMREHATTGETGIGGHGRHARAQPGIASEAVVIPSRRVKYLQTSRFSTFQGATSLTEKGSLDVPVSYPKGV
jgi:hypothetical protein